MWNNLISFSNNVHLPWLVLGDFNEVTFAHEKIGGNKPKEHKMRLYRETMDSCNLRDLGFIGSKFTWFNKRKKQPIFERLDRCWASPSWIMEFPNAIANNLPRLTSDHNPILLALNHTNQNRNNVKYFKYEPYLVSEPGFDKWVQMKWAKNDNGFPSKLTDLSLDIPKWIDDNCNIFKNKRRLMARLSGAQLALQGDPTNPFLFDLEAKLNRELNLVLDQEECFWQIRARTNWVLQGDRNTHFFHLSTIIRRKSNKINMIKDGNENSTTDQSNIEQLFIDFYKDLFNSNNPEILHQIGSLESIDCSETPSLVETKEALFSIGGTKAPGDDGFHAVFFQHFWDNINNDYYELIKKIFKDCTIPSSLNTTLISLIPKIENPLRVQNFRPISLVNTTYKIVTKILVQRIRTHLHDIISPNQNSFIPGRGSEVNVIIATEILHSMKKKKGKKGLFALKLDLEKAYDRLEWYFIEYCLTMYNFSNNTIKLIMSCVSSSSASIQVNGHRTNPFRPTRGIRQGDPLSPYLFILCLEYLSRKIHEACFHKDWKPFKLRGGETEISHLLFADDIILFGEANQNTLTTMKIVLENFFSISGQKANDSKSMVYFSPNTPIEMKDEFEQELNIMSTHDLGIYLGFPLCHRKPSKGKLSFIIDKMTSKLASWKAKSLTKAGRLILINSTLHAIPRYFMHVINFPKYIIKKLDAICGNFFWSGGGGKSKIPWIAWNKLCKPKNQGGLGCLSNSVINKVSLSRLCWKLDNHTTWAAKFLHEKYVNKKDHPTHFNKGSYLWRGVGVGWQEYCKSLAWKIGNGEDINIWYDKWINGDNLNSLVMGPPTLFESKITLNELNNKDLNQTFSFNFPPHIIDRVSSLQLTNRKDKTYSLWTKNNKFDSKLATAEITSNNQLEMGDWEWIWASPGHPKHQFFI